MPGLFSAVALFIKQLTLLVSYVKNNAFPQPLAEDEEDKHLKLMAQGNQHSRNGGEERTQREIAKELGISRSYVYGIEKGRS